MHFGRRQARWLRHLAPIFLEILMNRRTRKFIGMIGMIAFVMLYALIVMGLAPRILIGAHKGVEMAFYLVAGLAWVIPLLPLIRWMEKPSRSERA
jgi:uncharacterized membrane protein YuzA (DUF378 family)